MKTSDWEAQLISLIKRHSSKNPLPALRNAFSDAVRDAISRGKLDEDDARFLNQVRSRLELWRSVAPPTLKEAWSEWLALRATASSRIPASILDVLMTRLPVGKGDRLQLDLTELAPLGPDLIARLLKQRLLRSADIVKLAKRDPAGVYESPVLDAMLARGFAVPRKVWDQAKSRPMELQPRRGTLIRAYELDHAADAASWLARQALTVSEESDAILLAILRNPGLAFRFVHDLVGPRSPLKGGAAKRDMTARAQVLQALVQLLQPSSDESDRANAMTRSVALGLVRIAAQGMPEGAAAKAVQFAKDELAAGFTALIQYELAHSESSVADGVRRPLLTVSPDELSHAVNQFIGGLPVGGGAEFESVERGQRYHRFQGRREVIQLVVTALSDIQTGADPAQAIEVALFNAGVKELGELGQEAAFDPRVHETATPGVTPGARVQVMRIGRVVGEGVMAMVIVKAGVDLMGRENNEE
jgi:hypothetical protein